MKISVFIKNPSGWYAKELKKEASKKRVALEFLQIKNLNDPELINNIGDVVFWRSADIDRHCGKNIALKLFERNGAQIVNLSNLKRPFIIHKLYQQKILEGKGIVNIIPTFTFHTKKELIHFLKEKNLKFPFIGKPNLGSKGEGIFLFKNQKDITRFKEEIGDYIFQNYLENDGDYRVLFLGGKSLGVMKRIAQKGNFLNNVSQGGRTEKVKDKETLNKLTSIAEKIASKFELNFCGVDLIKDQKTGKYYFLELNTAAQWQGFQKQTGVNVSGELLDYFKGLGQRKTRNVYSLVEDYYKNSYSCLLDKKFHYVSRLFLWSNRSQFVDQMKDLKAGYFGKSKKDAFDKISNNLKLKADLSRINFGGIRGSLFKKYSNLFPYSKVLFFYLFSKNIYEEDLSENIFEKIDKEDLLKMAKELHKNPRDIFILATFATNFLFILEELIGRRITKPRLYLKILKKYAEEPIKGDANLTFAVYLATHCVIGESRFYSRKIKKNKQIYKKMLKYVEKLILDNFLAIKLDCKLEFIVCCRILGMDTCLEAAIKQEAENSISPIGNFLIDKFNFNNKLDKNLSLRDAEHRNVLYLMAYSKKND